MLGLFSWIPVIGPLVDGIVSMFSKFEDSKVETYKVDGQVRVQEVQSSTQSLIAFKDDIGVRITRDIILFPVSVWTALIVWDKIVANPFPNLVWSVLPLTEATGLSMLPFAVLAFLFGQAAMNTWKR